MTEIKIHFKHCNSCTKTPNAIAVNPTKCYCQGKVEQMCVRAQSTRAALCFIYGKWDGGVYILNVQICV